MLVTILHRISGLRSWSFGWPNSLWKLLIFYLQNPLLQIEAFSWVNNFKDRKKGSR